MANSSTQLASLVQRTNAVMQEAQGRIAAIFSELDEASPAEALHPASLADLNTMQRYETLVWERLAFAENAIERIDALLAEVQEQSDIINNDPDDAARSFKRVVDERLGELRSVYPQRVHLTQRVVLAAADTLAFMRSRFGSYHVQNESIDFDKF